MHSTPTEQLQGPPTANNFDLLVDQFEQAWRNGTAPDLATFLPTGAERQRVLEELVKIDLEYRWRTSPTRPLVEDYLRLHPELGTSDRVPVGLVEEEYRVRQRWGDRPAIAEYTRRFPACSELESRLGTVQEDLRVEFQRTSATRIANRYIRRHCHAVGGLGEVWLAHDTLVGRDVAMKELRPELASQPNLRRRFLHEARLTGRLEHPGVVPLYELIEPSGTNGPLYAMRFLNGRTLGEAIQEHHRNAVKALSLRALLGAFVSVCNTLAYAHSRDVIHRDLKPANILVGDFGEVIVLDWGLAKVRGEGESVTSPDREDAPSLTRDGQVLGTPAYMAPEQAAGELDRIDPRTDVFGLGAILHEILTGRPLYTGLGTDEILNQARECTPLPPRRIRRDTPPALDAICRKATARDPAARYASASELAADVQRWLADEPVSVYRDPLSTRIVRWARRHRTLVASLTVLLLTGVVALSVGTVLIAREQRRSEEARDRAEANFQRAMAVVDQFCTRISEETLLDEPGLQPLRQRLLRDALEFYREFVADPSAGPETRAEMGRAHWRLGDLTESLTPGPTARQHYLTALEHFQTLTASDPHSPRLQADTAGVQNSLGNWHLQHQQSEEAEKWYRAALQRRQQLVEDDPESVELRRNLARSHNNLGVLYRQTERLPDAATELRASAEEFAELVRRQPDSVPSRVDEAWARVNLGVVLRAKRDRGAEAEFQHALKLLDNPADITPSGVAARAAAHNNLGELYRGSFRSKPAEEEYRKAIALLEPLARNNPAVTGYRRDLARCRFNLASVLAVTFRAEEAEETYREALDAFERLANDYPSVPEYTLELGKNCLSLASLYALTGKNDAVVKCCDRAAGALDTLARNGQERAAKLLRSLLFQRALARGKLERYADAVRDWDRIVELDGGTTPLAERLERMALMTRAGQPLRAGAEAYRLTGEKWTGTQLYDLAVILALASNAANQEPGESKLLVDRYAESCVQMLEKAREAGYFRKSASVSQMKNDPAFNGVRNCATFVRLLEKLQP